jgi:hypothetical protein
LFSGKIRIHPMSPTQIESRMTFMVFLLSKDPSSGIVHPNS